MGASCSSDDDPTARHKRGKQLGSLGKAAKRTNQSRSKLLKQIGDTTNPHNARNIATSKPTGKGHNGSTSASPIHKRGGSSSEEVPIAAVDAFDNVLQQPSQPLSPNPAPPLNPLSAPSAAMFAPGASTEDLQEATLTSNSNDTKGTQRSRLREGSASKMTIDSTRLRTATDCPSTAQSLSLDSFGPHVDKAKPEKLALAPVTHFLEKVPQEPVKVPRKWQDAAREKKRKKIAIEERYR